MTPHDMKWSPLAEVRRLIGEHTATLVFTRTLMHSPEKVWRALTEPREQLEWLPYVADRAMDSVGPVRLTMTDGGEVPVTLDGEVLECTYAKSLSYRWGEDLLTWELKPSGGGTVLTLRHETKLVDKIAGFAAGWHICIDVAQRFLDGAPVGRIVGHDALEAGWPELHRAYLEKLG